MWKSTLQATALAALSNVLAQSIKARQQDEPRAFSLDYSPIIQFILFTLISAPINIRWQEELERALPSFVNQPDSHVSVKDKPVTKPVRSNRNTVAKIVLDQTLGATFNVVLFIALMGALKGAPMNQTLGKVQRDFWPMMKAGWSLWPLVSIISFTLIPPAQRVVFGSVIGVGWNVFLSLSVS